ncbi:MAG: hypothetical protein ACMZ66_11665 [Thalassospira sp.]|uniref:hypothetical protein n=1 Tax=Thalassospira sp. TaxID=1912094 RepID=UPI003A84E71E
MSLHKTAKCLPVLALAFAMSGCLHSTEEPVTVANSSQTIVTPWGPPANGAAAAPSTTAQGTTTSNLVMMEDPSRKVLALIQQQQIDEARIALGILDRMAQRCVQDGDAAACATLQTNWSTLSQQLHKTLTMISADTTMESFMSNPSSTAPMPSMSDDAQPMVQPIMPAPVTNTPAMPAPATNGTEPSMEKVIPMTEPGADG